MGYTHRLGIFLTVCNTTTISTESDLFCIPSFFEYFLECSNYSCWEKWPWLLFLWLNLNRILNGTTAVSFLNAGSCVLQALHLNPSCQVLSIIWNRLMEEQNLIFFCYQWDSPQIRISREGEHRNKKVVILRVLFHLHKWQKHFTSGDSYNPWTLTPQRSVTLVSTWQLFFKANSFHATRKTPPDGREKKRAKKKQLRHKQKKNQIRKAQCKLSSFQRPPTALRQSQKERSSAKSSTILSSLSGAKPKQLPSSHLWPRCLDSHWGPTQPCLGLCYKSGHSYDKGWREDGTKNKITVLTISRIVFTVWWRRRL